MFNLLNFLDNKGCDVLRAYGYSILVVLALIVLGQIETHMNFVFLMISAPAVGLTAGYLCRHILIIISDYLDNIAVVYGFISVVFLCLEVYFMGITVMQALSYLQISFIGNDLAIPVVGIAYLYIMLDFD